MIDPFFKLGLPVLMIGIVTLVSQRYGPAVGGILGAVPAKGGPILLFLALEQNVSFAATSAAASLGGAGGCGVFCLVYARLCHGPFGAIAFFLIATPAIEGFGILPAFGGAL